MTHFTAHSTQAPIQAPPFEVANVPLGTAYQPLRPIDYLLRILSPEALSPSAVRYIPSMHKDQERWGVAGKHVSFFMASGAIPPVSYQDGFGNPFVYSMEHFARQITDSIDGALHVDNTLQEVRTSLANLPRTHRNYCYLYNRMVDSIGQLSMQLRQHEKALARHVAKLMHWAERCEVTYDTKQFFELYSTQYFGEALCLTDLAQNVQHSETFAQAA